MAVREDETVAQAMGVNTVNAKLLAFVVGAVLGSFSGAIFAAKVGSVFPTSFMILVSIIILVVVIFGGMGNIVGVIVGAAVLIGVLGGPKQPGLLQEFSQFKLLIYGALLVWMMLARPQGLIPSVRRTRELHHDEYLQDAWMKGHIDVGDHHDDDRHHGFHGRLMQHGHHILHRGGRHRKHSQRDSADRKHPHSDTADRHRKHSQRDSADRKHPHSDTADRHRKHSQRDSADRKHPHSDTADRHRKHSQRDSADRKHPHSDTADRHRKHSQRDSADRKHPHSDTDDKAPRDTRPHPMRTTHLSDNTEFSERMQTNGTETPEPRTPTETPEPRTPTEAAAQAPLLEIRGLSVSFGGIDALTDLDLTVHEGEIVSLIGPNGAGKTTLFNAVTATVPVTEGDIVFEGRSLLGLDSNHITFRGIARTFQNVRLFANMTVLENVMVSQHCRVPQNILGTLLCSRAFRREELKIRERAERILGFFGTRLVGFRLGQPASTLSYANRRRLEIARAMATQPKLILLDEPVAGMNPVESAELTELIGELRRGWGFGIVVIEHDMKVVSAVSDRVVVLDHGRKIAEGAYSEVVTNPQVVEAYLGRGATARTP